MRLGCFETLQRAKVYVLGLRCDFVLAMVLRDGES